MIVFHLDDDRATRTSVETLVSDAGFVYVGSDQWVKISAELFALKGRRAILIADLSMPGIRGEDFCRTTIKHCPGVVVVLHSGSDGIKAAAERLGCKYAPKGGDPYRLIEAIHSAVTASRRKPDAPQAPDDPPASL